MALWAIEILDSDRPTKNKLAINTVSDFVIRAKEINPNPMVEASNEMTRIGFRP